MKALVVIEITGDIDEEAMTVDEKLDLMEEVLSSGGESCCMSSKMTLVKFIQGDEEYEDSCFQ